MNKILPISMTLLLAILFNHSSAQTLLKEDFNTAIPTNWTINSSGGTTWMHDAQLGINNTGCMMVDESSTANPSKGSIALTKVDLTAVANPILNYKVAIIKNNFITPVLNVYYSVSGGAWQKLSSWGEYQTDYIINTSGPCATPLASSCAEWVSITYDLSALASNNDIRFSFEADISNGGWLLIDDIYIGEKNKYTLPYTTGFDEQYFLPEDWQETNQSNISLLAWQKDGTVGSFGSGTPCIKFDNMNSNPDSTYTLDMVWLDLTTATTPMFSFSYAYAIRTGKPSDELSIWYTIGSTGTPTKLVEFKDTGLTTTFDKANLFVPNGRDWRVKTIDLSQFAGVGDIRFSMQNKSKNGNTIYIDDIYFYDDATTSISQNIYSNEIMLYPNPAQDQLIVELNNATVVGLVVFDVSGRQLSNVTYTQVGQHIQVNTASLSNGIYYMQVQQGKDSVNKKFVINR